MVIGRAIVVVAVFGVAANVLGETVDMVVRLAAMVDASASTHEIRAGVEIPVRGADTPPVCQPS